MGKNQWFQPTVRNRLSQAIVLANFTILYGKFYDINNRFEETASVQGTKIPSDNQYEWGHCSRENAAPSTEGTFEVHLDGSDERIAEIYWDCPYIGGNKLEIRNVKAGYDISFDGFSIPSGALGYGTITVRED